MSNYSSLNAILETDIQVEKNGPHFLVAGTGYRGTVERLNLAERTAVKEAYSNWARITIGLPAENRLAQDALRAALKQS